VSRLRSVPILALALVLLAAGSVRAEAPVLAVRALRSLPHDPEAFTQGLVFHQGSFYESTGLYGRSTLRRVDPETGRVLALTRLAPRLFGEGLALCPDGRGRPRLVQLTWREGRILTYDPAGLRPRQTLPLRGQGWGLACHGGRAYLSDGSDTLRLLDAASLAETGRLAVRDGDRPVPELNELEWVNGWLLANVWGLDRVAAIDPGTGRVAAWLDLSALRRELGPQAEAANGLAFDEAGDALYATGKRWERVFVLELPELLRRPPR
jgi:glutamine cyclotransferase